MNLPEAVRNYLSTQGMGKIMYREPVGGGCINHGERLVCQEGRSFFLKSNSSAPPAMFEREAEGLTALQAAGGPRVPQVFLFAEDFILLEDLRPAVRQAGFWEDLGQSLARLHHHTAEQFGFAHDNFIGSTHQPNGWMADGFAFFAERRLFFQARLAQRNGRLTSEQVGQVERLAARLPSILPAQPASLLHGDLWSGNVISDPNGAPALIDPAVWYGWAEADLAMTALFGGFPERFYQAYANYRPLTPGYRQRFPLYNLYHLLNHLNLFGVGYLGEVEMILRQFTH